ncbi:MAG: J domain-containing protein [Thiotrichaceae bacterium]|nr:J domain-containing protein [Thiotrichaceae bacterium]
MTTQVNYFSNCTTLDEVKAIYRKLVAEFHPDRHRTDAKTQMTKIMQRINEQYEKAKSQIEQNQEQPIYSAKDLERCMDMMMQRFDPYIQACQTLLVNELLEKEVISYEDIEREPIFLVEILVGEDAGCSEYLTEATLQSYKEAVNAEIERLDAIDTEQQIVNQGELTMSVLQEHLEELEYLDPEYDEIYEWWLCKNDSFEWFGIKKQYIIVLMSEVGEPVLITDYGTWWGRTTTGQSIWADEHVWLEIGRNLKIF